MTKGQGSKHQDKKKGDVNKIQYTRPSPLNVKCPNYVVFDLNGSPSDVRRNWQRTILILRLWCFNNTDERYQFGNPCSSSCMIPATGKFFVYIHWSSDWLCAIIDGPSLYLDGYTTRSEGEEHELRVRENDNRHRTKPMLIEKSKALPWCGNYKAADLCIFGYYGLIPAFKEMHAFVQTGKYKSKAKLELAGQTFIWHLPEAGRSDILFQDIDGNFLIGGKFGLERLEAVRCWSYESDKAISGMHFAEKSETSACPAKKQDTTPEMKRTIDIIENIRLLYRPHHVHAILQLRDMPMHLGKEGPIGDLWANQQLIDVHMPSFSFLSQRISISGSYSIGSLVEENTCSATDDPPVRKATEKLDYFEEKAAIDGHGVGLYNLGDTCYMNSTIQCLNRVPELKAALTSYSHNVKRDGVDATSHNLSIAADNIFSKLDTDTEAFSPLKLLETLRAKYPTFAEQENDVYRQQDAEECWTGLLNAFSETFASETSESTADQVKEIFGIELVSRSNWAENGAERLKTHVNLIRCPITDGMNHLDEVLEYTLRTGDSIYEKYSEINELPRYFTIQLCRMWDEKQNRLAKIFDKVSHPLQLDLYGYCSDEMKLKLQATREVAESGGLGSSSMETDQFDSTVPKKQLTGIYNLVAVLTHKGPTANHGHYVAWVKQANEIWVQFSDEMTSAHEDSEILELCGGADDKHVAYIYLYKAQLT